VSPDRKESDEARLQSLPGKPVMLAKVIPVLAEAEAAVILVEAEVEARIHKILVLCR
jgi:hypothetical protein